MALGTSAPEIFVAVTSSLQGEPELAVGNAIGSNIANIGMVLGITALIIPLPFRDDILKKDLPIMFLVTLCAGATLVDFHLGFWDGLLLFACLATFLYRLAHRALGKQDSRRVKQRMTNLMLSLSLPLITSRNTFPNSMR